jgi:hypothetical protein
MTWGVHVELWFTKSVLATSEDTGFPYNYTIHPTMRYHKDVEKFTKKSFEVEYLLWNSSMLMIFNEMVSSS